MNYIFSIRLKKSPNPDEFGPPRKISETPIAAEKRKRILIKARRIPFNLPPRMRSTVPAGRQHPSQVDTAREKLVYKHARHRRLIMKLLVIAAAVSCRGSPSVPAGRLINYTYVRAFSRNRRHRLGSRLCLFTLITSPTESTPPCSGRRRRSVRPSARLFLSVSGPSH